MKTKKLKPRRVEVEDVGWGYERIDVFVSENFGTRVGRVGSVNQPLYCLQSSEHSLYGSREREKIQKESELYTSVSMSK